MSGVLVSGGPKRIRTAVAAFAEQSLATRPSDQRVANIHNLLNSKNMDGYIRAMNVKNLVPNALTMGNLLGGVYVCMMAATGGDLMSGVVAGVWVLAMVFDLLDGMVARALGVDGPMGVQLDSMADLVTGGLAPSFVAYRLICEAGACESLVMNVLPMTLVMAAAYRLSRYNVRQSSVVKEGFFEGLPAPAAGVYWMGVMMWWGVAQSDLEIRVLMVVAGLGMVALPLFMVMSRGVLGLKGWGADAKIDRLRGILGLIYVVIAVVTWFVWGNMFAAVPLCVLLHSCASLLITSKTNTLQK